MRGILSLVLALLLLLSVAGCGSHTPSSESEIDDPNAYLSDLFHGIYKLEERDGAYGDPKVGGGAFIPMRFPHERLVAYEEYNKTAKIAAPYFNCSTGVRMDFYTDADTISFHYTVTAGFFDGNPEYAVDTFNIFENGEYQTSQDVIKGTPGDVIYSRKSSDPESRITIVFPNYHGVCLSQFRLGHTRPVVEYDHKILVFGDSISQGLFADKPADGYVHQVCAALNADYMNLSVGGEVYRSNALDEDINFDPTHIIVALGTNDYYSGTLAAKVRSNATAYFQQLEDLYPDVPVTVITPFGNIPEEYHDSIQSAATPFGYHVINGTSLISKSTASWSKDKVHPSSTGFNEITAALIPILQQVLS